MADKNNGWVVKSLVGFMFTIIFVSITTIASNVICNDKDSRKRDYALEEKIHLTNENIHEAVLEQQVQNGKTNVTLERILVKLEAIDKNGRTQ